MKTEYNDSSIEIKTNQKDGDCWTVVVQVRPGVKAVNALSDQRELEGYKNQGEAEKAGLRWGRDRIDAYAQNRRLMA